MYKSCALCQEGRSQNIVLRSYVYILGQMPGGMVPEYSTGILCIYPVQEYSYKSGFLYIYPGPYVSWEGTRVCLYCGVICIYSYGLMYILVPMSGASSKCIVLGSFVYIYGPMSVGKASDNSTGFLCLYPGPCVSWEGPRI